MRTPSPALFALLFAVAPAAVQAQPEADPSRFLRWAYRDAVDLAHEVDWRTPAYAAGALAVLAPLSDFDDNINPKVRSAYHGPLAGFLNAANELGGPRVTLPVAGLFAASLATDDARFQDAAFTSLQALVYAGAISYGVKYAVGRMRPKEEGGALEFAPFSGHNSFPSGHTATAFAVVTPWVLYYPNAGTYTLFAVSTGTAVARLARNRHWATDVVAGGSIGFLTAYWLTKQHQGEAPRVQVTPIAGKDAMTLVLQVRL